jgi:flagellar assembly protein FliH
MRIHHHTIQVGEDRPIEPARADMTQLTQSYEDLKARLLADVRRERQSVLAAAADELKALQEAAKAQAQRTLAAAEADSHAVREAAREAGYADGFRQGRVDGLTDVMLSVQALADSLKEAEQRLFYSIREDLAQLMEAVCQQVTHHQMQGQPEHWLALIEAAIQQCLDAKHIRVVLPEPLVQELLALFPDATHLHMVPDRQLKPGQAFVITEKTSLAFGLDSQITTLLSAIKPEHQIDPTAVLPEIDTGSY